VDPSDARALVGLGELAAFSNRAKEALSYALRAMAADPDHPGARTLAATLYLRSGRARLEDGDAAGALESAKRADELAGESATLCLLRADAFRRKGDWKPALAEVERARTLAPNDPEVKDGVAAHYRDICYAFLLGGRRDQAEEALKRAEGAGSTRVDLVEVRRLFEKKTGATASPSIDPAMAATLDRLVEEAHRLADEGAALYNGGKAAEAAEKFRESLRNFQTAHGHFGLGLSLQKAGDAPGAEKEFRFTTEIDPTHADAWLNLGAALYRRSDDAGAAAAYGNYLRFAPKEGAEETVLRVEALLGVLKERRERGQEKR
jgi:tetratricopeptide (TPR) repeat protein